MLPTAQHPEQWSLIVYFFSGLVIALHCRQVASVTGSYHSGQCADAAHATDDDFKHLPAGSAHQELCHRNQVALQTS